MKSTYTSPPRNLILNISILRENQYLSAQRFEYRQRAFIPRPLSFHLHRAPAHHTTRQARPHRSHHVSSIQNTSVRHRAHQPQKTKKSTPQHNTPQCKLTSDLPNQITGEKKDRECASTKETITAAAMIKSVSSSTVILLATTRVTIASVLGVSRLSMTCLMRTAVIAFMLD